MSNRITIEDLSKRFVIKKSDGALAKVLSWLKNKKATKLWALKNISLSVAAGENLGVIGSNGSGKSTLLRLIAGIYQATSGRIKTDGKITYLSGFGYGLKSKLTMRENIFLVAAIFGLSQDAIKERFDDIVRFSQLEDFLDVRVQKFSSGMIVRLNFSIGINCLRHYRPDILLLDEVFGGVGDLKFSQQSIMVMEEIISSPATVVFVSHDLNKVKRYCDKVIWLDRGVVVRYGKAEEVVGAYQNSI